MANRYIGLMSGTSLDGIDAVAIELDGNALHLVASHCHPMPDELRNDLLVLASGGGEDELERMARSDVLLGRLFAEAVHTLLAQSGLSASEIQAIGSHGQTIRHLPGAHPAATVQIGDPNTLAELTGITTVADFRRRDLAAGGQGAPLVPAFHAARLRQADRNRVVVNIGGMANITVLPADPQQPVSGFDTGPGNVLMDAWASEHLDQPFDRHGAWAAEGRIIPELLAACLADPYFALPPPKSTGREYFHLAWLKLCNPHLAELPAADVQASLCALTARSIAQAVRDYAPATQEVFVCGGGVHNTTLMQQLAALLPECPVVPTDQAGLPADWMEAMAFAWLAHQTLSARPGNLPSVTGAHRPVILGGIYPGR